MADPFHQAAITGNDIGVVVNKAGAEFRGKMPFGHGHAHRIGKPLAKRPGGGFDSRCMAEFRMAGGDRPQLAEIADLRDGHIGMAGQVQQRIDQHRSVTGGQHKTVTVRPVRVCRIEFHMVGKQRGCRIRHAHRHAGVS